MSKKNIKTTDASTAEGENILSVDPKTLTDSKPLVPGLSSSHYDALKASIAANGQLKPILATRDGVVHDGRLVRRACMDLGIPAKVRHISDKEAESCWLASCAHREWTIPDCARLIAHVIEMKLYESVPPMAKKERINSKVSRYLREKVGWKCKVNTYKQVQRFNELFELMQTATEDKLSELEACGTVNAALRLLKPVEPTRDKTKVDPVLNSIRLMQKWIEDTTPIQNLNDSDIGKVKAAFEKAKNILDSVSSPHDTMGLLAGNLNISKEQTAA